MPLLGAGVVAVLTGLALLHVFWVLSGGGVPMRVLPEKPGVGLAVRPTPVMTVSVAGALGAAALTVAWFVAAPSVLTRAGVLVLAGVFLVRAVGDLRYVGFFKRVRGTVFARYDTALYSPLCLLLGLALMLLGLATGGP